MKECNFLCSTLTHNYIITLKIKNLKIYEQLLLNMVLFFDLVGTYSKESHDYSKCFFNQMLETNFQGCIFQW